MPPATRQDANRKLAYASTQFMFLGFTFRARTARSRGGGLFASFQPAISKQALKKISEQVRSWRLHRWSHASWKDIARFANPKVAGWMACYGAFCRSALYPVLQRISSYLVRWMRRKYKRLRSKKKALDIWWRIVTDYPRCLIHWKWTVNPWRTR